MTTESKERVVTRTLDGSTRRRLSAARLVATALQPFLSDALFSLVPVAAPGLNTFAVDERLRLYVDPVVVDRWTIEQCAAVLLHEVGHVIRDHAGRARGIGVDEPNHLRWNWAADAEINDDLVADGCDLPPTPVLPSRFGAPSGKTAEFYWTCLGDRQPKWSLNCGSGAHGAAGLDPLVPGGAASQSEPDIAGLNQVELTLLRKRVAEAVLASGRHAGSGGGGWERWASAFGQPQIDWRALLQTSVRRAVSAGAGHSTHTYQRLPRRRVPGVVLPALERPNPIVSVIVDTSASMDDAALGAAWNEVLGVLRSIGVRRDLLRVYAGDVGAERVRGPLAKRVALTGGGGTDMAMSIEQTLADRPSPQCVIVLTDGFTPWPDKAPRTRVVVCLIGENAPAPPSWARCVAIPSGPSSGM